MTQLVKFTPMVVLETYDGEIYFSNQQIGVVAEELNSKTFVVLNGHGIATKAIKTFYVDIYGLNTLTRWQLKEIIGWRRRYTDIKMTEPTAELIMKKITRIKNGEKLT